MATDLSALYPGRVLVNANYPRGAPQNSTVPGAFDKTPLDEGWGQDMWGFLDIILQAAGVTPDGAPDNVLASQRYDALIKLSREDWQFFDGAHVYSRGALARASGLLYYSLQPGNQGNNPGVSPAWWKELKPVDVIDNLTSTSVDDALSANQGKILKDLIDAITTGSATTATQGVSYLKLPRTIANNGGDPNNSIDFSAAKFDFDDGSGQALAPGWTKNLSLAWGAGNGQGMLDTGVIAPSTWYYIYDIYNPATEVSDYIATATLGSPTLPAGFTKKQYRAAKYRKSDNTNNQIRQFGKNFVYVDPFPEYSAIIGSNQVLTLVTPPGLNVKVFLDCQLRDRLGGGVAQVEVRSTFQTPTGLANLGTPAAPGTVNYFELFTDTLSQIVIDYLAGPGDLGIYNRGYFDPNIKG